MTRRILMANGELRVSRIGVDVVGADPEDLLLGAGIYPTQILISGITHIASPATTGVVLLPYALPFVPLAIFSSTTPEYFQDPYGGWTSSAIAGSKMEVTPSQLNFTVPAGADRYIAYIVTRVARGT